METQALIVSITFTVQQELSLLTMPMDTVLYQIHTAHSIRILLEDSIQSIDLEEVDSQVHTYVLQLVDLLTLEQQCLRLIMQEVVRLSVLQEDQVQYLVLLQLEQVRQELHVRQEITEVLRLERILLERTERQLTDLTVVALEIQLDRIITDHTVLQELQQEVQV